jgi:periplasmic protein TonB
MATYGGTARQDRAKALAGVLLVHVGLGALILTGLNVKMVQHAVEQLKTFDIKEVVPPKPEPPPQPAPKPDRAKDDAGAPAKKANPTPVVAPKPAVVLPVKPPVVAAPVAGTGSAPSSGAAAAGTGTGAGGSGDGRGGGGRGDYSGFTPARLVRNLNRGDYRQIAVGRLPAGRAVVSLQLNAEGVPTGCRVARSSGDAYVDAGLCPLATRRLRFSPARDDQGRPIPYRLEFVANWAL